MAGVEVEGTVAAARELSHAACHLASSAGGLARESDAPEVREAARRALEASLAAASAAFALDDGTRARASDAEMLALALEATQAAEGAVRAARAAIEAHLLLVAGGGHAAGF